MLKEKSPHLKRNSKNIIDTLKLSLSGKLPGSNSHIKMIPHERQLEILPKDRLSIKESSVLIILYPEESGIKCILIKRPETMKNHAGQIAFPGGVIDKSDKNSLDTALREANEEVGIDISRVEIIGQLSELFVHVSKFLIYPFIGWCNSKPELIPNQFEVDKIIEFPLSNYIPDKKINIHNIQTTTGCLDVPCYKFKNEIIWGATAMILTELLDILRIKSFKEESH